MRNFLLIFIIVFFTMNLHSQTKIAEFEDFPKEILGQMDKMGIDECSMLTQIEGMYFNILFQDLENDFDFCGKKVAFLSGSLGKIVSNKKIYFTSEQKSFEQGESPTFAFLYIFNDVQKKEVGGYDVAIVTWSKKHLSVESVVKTLKKNL